MDLHELLAAAVDDPPPLPDQVPIAAETLRRRRARTRRSLLASACGLAVAAGTATITAPWRHTGTSAAPVSAKSSSPAPKSGPTVTTTPARPTQFQKDATTLLQSVWPVSGAHVVWDAPQVIPNWPAKTQPTLPGSAFVVKAGGVTATMGLTPRRWAADPGAPAPDRCGSPPIGFGSIDFTCASTTTKDGATVLVLRSAQTEGGPRYTEIELWKGPDELYLSVDGLLAQGITDKQFVTLAESSAYTALFAEGEHLGLFAADTNDAVGG